MRMLLLLRLVLAAAGALLASGDMNANSRKINVSPDKSEDKFGAEDRNKVVSNVEMSLLSLLGLKKRPRPLKPAYVPESLKQLYVRQNNIGTADIDKPGIHARSSNTVRTFSHIESAVDQKFRSSNKFRLLFNVSLPATEMLHAAQLTLNRVSIDLDDKNREPLTLSDLKLRSVRILVHDIMQPGSKKSRRKPILRLLDGKWLDVTSNSSVSLDVQPAVQRWLSTGSRNNHGLLVQVDNLALPKNTEHVRLRRSLEESSATWALRQPLLYTYSDDGRNQRADAKSIMENRAKRAALHRNSRKRDGRGNCRRHQLYVDFADVGWNDWIVAPPGYDAFYCHGDCPFPLSDHLNSTNHAIVQNLVYSINPSIVPKACCVPTALSSISMLYLDEENKVVLKNYQDMAVLGCGCR